MNAFRPLAAATLAAMALFALCGPAAAQTGSAPPPAKTIGRPQQPQIADRPIRSAGHALTAHLLEEWSDSAPDSFAKTAPNATVSVFNKAKAGVSDVVVVLKSPKLEGERLVFDVDLLEGDLAGADGAASVFIDIVNLPIARRTSHRGAWYAGAQ